MNHQYYLICRLYVRPGGQEQLHEILMTFLCSRYEGRPSVLEFRETEYDCAE